MLRADPGKLRPRGSEEPRGRQINTALSVAAVLMMAAHDVDPARAQQTPRPSYRLAQAETQDAPGPAPATARPEAIHGQRANKSTKNRRAPLYHLLGFSLSGTNRVDTDALVAALPQHKGDLITHEQVKKDADLIRAQLKSRHVHGDMTTTTLEREGPGHYIMVVWDIHLLDALSYAPPDASRHFLGQTFSGNVDLNVEKLTAATGLKPGQTLPDGSIGEARTGIEQAYDKALPNKTVDVKGKVILKKDHTVLINWQITEGK